MAIVFDQIITLGKRANNKQYYIDNGYAQIDSSGTLSVHIKHLKSNSYAQIDLVCDKCKSPFKREYTKLRSPNHFCSRSCYRKWYAEDWSQRESWRDESRRRAVKILEDGLISKTESDCQIILNNILNDLNINYINEYGFEIVSVDNYLLDHNLAIEVMGTYWHCDPRRYSEIDYQMQFDRIKHDKRKRSIIKKLAGINILYLWERDLKENPEMCSCLVEEYIQNDGELNNYHSFNYRLAESKALINNDFIDAYFEKDVEFLKSIFIPKDGIKKSKKQLDKWIAFICECCEQETEQLKSRYRKSKNHFCSQECKKVNQMLGEKGEIGGVLYKCDFCTEEFKARNYLYQALKTGKRKHLFCSYECHHNHQRRDGIDSDKHGKPYDEEFLINEFYRFKNEHGKYPTRSDFLDNDNYPSIKVYEFKWGSWKKFLESLNILGSNGWFKEDEDILREYYPSNNIKAIQERLSIDISGSAIKNHANRIGLTVLTKKDRIDKEEFILMYYEKDMSTKEIAKFYSCSQSAIQRFMKDNDIKIKEGYWTEERVEYLIRSYSKISWEELLSHFKEKKKSAIAAKARKLNLSRSRI